MAAINNRRPGAAAIVNLIVQYGDQRAVYADTYRPNAVRVQAESDAAGLLDRIRRALAAVDQLVPAGCRSVPATDLPMLLAKHAPDLPYIGLALLAEQLHEAGYQVVKAGDVA